MLVTPALPLVALLLNGTAHTKRREDRYAELWFALGVLLAGLLAARGASALHLGGALAGLLLAAHRGLAAASAALIGSIVACGVVSVAAVLAAFGCGCRLLDDSVWSSPMASAALTAMTLGVLGACWAPQVAAYVKGAEERSPLLEPVQLGRAWEDASLACKGLGVATAVAAGICGGAVLVPCVLAPAPQLLEVLPSLGVGALVGSAVVVAAADGVRRYTDAPAPAIAAPGPDVLVGAVWGAACAALLVAVRELGYARTVPLFHCHGAVVMAARAARNELEGALHVLLASLVFLLVGAIALFVNTHQG